MAPPLSFTYHLAATFFQFIVAGALLTGRRSFVRFAFAFVILLSGFETLEFALGSMGHSMLSIAQLEAVDILIALSLPFVLLHVPRPAGLRKLVNLRLRGSERDVRDLLSILIAQWETFDFDYVRTHAGAHRVGAAFQRFAREAKSERQRLGLAT